MVDLLNGPSLNPLHLVSFSSGFVLFAKFRISNLSSKKIKNNLRCSFLNRRAKKISG